jgi:hypothetical protein
MGLGRSRCLKGRKMKWYPQNYNDLLSLMLIVLLIPAMWILQGVKVITAFPAEVNGALILAWGNIIQHYFRKAPSEKH